MQDIKEYLSYDPLTGEFTWAKSPSPRMKDGSTAGTPNKSGYIRIKYSQKLYLAHRLAWYMYYGEMPDYDIDHINEDPSDNRISNLRLDINRENEHNKSKLRSDNTSGYRGVYWNKLEGKWCASIALQGKRIFLGYYNTPEEAHEAYLCAKRKYHPFWVETKEEL